MLHIKQVDHYYGRVQSLRSIDLELQQGELLCLLGPSGCGKTTLLRVIAGLEEVTNGDVLLDGMPINDMPAHERSFGLMFQDFALFPHMNVEQNVGFGLRMRNVPDAQIRLRVQEVLNLVGLDRYGSRDVTELSGGERQRVALARSLAPHPRLLMLDEPLGSLDAALREQLAIDLRDIIKSTGISAIYVTHDQSEAFAIADRIIVMQAGRVVQAGSPQQLYLHPETDYVARFLGIDNVVRVTRFLKGKAETNLGTFVISGNEHEQYSAVLIHPNGISLGTDGGEYIIHGTVHKRVYRGGYYELSITPDRDTASHLVFSAPVNTEQIPQIGEAVTISIQGAMISGIHLTHQSSA